jgi:putative tricarboxylic transport membrane protein
MDKDGWSGIVLLVLAAAYYWASGAIPNSTLEDEVGAVGLPHALAGALALLGLILLVRAVRSARTSVAGGDEDGERDAKFPRAIGFLAFGAAYVLMLPYVGYLAGVALLIGAVALYEGAPRRWTIPAAAIGGAVLYWAVFVKLLGVNQPVGTLFQGLFS